jgi:hypothetical protein
MIAAISFHSGPAERRRGGPGGKRARGGGDGRVDFLRAGERNATNRLTHRRIINIAIFAACAGGHFATDEMSDLSHWPISRGRVEDLGRNAPRG